MGTNEAEKTLSETMQKLEKYDENADMERLYLDKSFDEISELKATINRSLKNTDNKYLNKMYSSQLSVITRRLSVLDGERSELNKRYLQGKEDLFAEIKKLKDQLRLEEGKNDD